MAEPAECVPSPASNRPRGSRPSQKLSGERLARKRELDRQAQRSARVKTKNHIAHLESRIEALTRISGNGNIKALTDQIEEQRKENETLRTTLTTIGKLVRSAADTAPTEEDKSGVKAFLPPKESPGAESTDHDSPEQEPTEHGTRDGPSNCEDLVLSSSRGNIGVKQPDLFPGSCSQNWIYDGMNDGLFFESQMAIGTMGDYSYGINAERCLLNSASLLGQADWPATQGPCCCRIYRFVNEIVSKGSSLQLQNSFTQKSRDIDIPIRAVVHGWNAVTKKYALDPLWTLIRVFDEAIFNNHRAVERLIFLWVLSFTLRYRVNPTERNLEAIPSYLRERPSQLFIQHIPLADFIVWPGFRERLVFSPHRYCSERSSFLFLTCFRFKWEYGIRDVYVNDTQTGLYQFSQSFLERALDLQSFRMTPKYFEEFPELRGDVSSTSPNPFDDGYGTKGPQEPSMLSAEVFEEYSEFLRMDWPTNPGQALSGSEL